MAALIGMAEVDAQTTPSCSPSSAMDWMKTALLTNQLAQDIRPVDCATVLQTPPDFRWPDVIASGGYTLTLTYPDGHSRSLPATQNWRNWDEILPPGNYSWTVAYGGGAPSATRQFFVDSGAKPFLLPNMNTLLGTVAAKAHPRSLPDAPTLATMKSQRANAVNSLLATVSAQFNQSLPSQGSGSADMKKYSMLALLSLQACVYGNQTTYCNDAIRRVMNLASWDPKGATSYLKDGRINYSTDAMARFLTWTVATGYDWLYPRLSSSQKTQLLTMLRIRNGDMYNDIVGTRSRIAREPRDSHANQTLTVVAVVATLLAGDLTEANSWLQNALPLALNAVSPWGGEEGGFANAATQGNWDMGENLRPWLQLRFTTGIDVAQKPWVRNWGRHFTYFTPPGMAANTTVFGDGFEYDEGFDQGLYGTAYTYFAPTPLGRWHASNLKLHDLTRMEYLMAPPADFSGPQVFPAGTPNSLYLPSIGQVAMHSDLANLARTSVYFKASPLPYGAYNHSHADQNSFVINAGGQRLAIESGYYDDYATAHWLNWYHSTRAKNAITYDGGKGQLFYEKDAAMGYGRVTNFSGSTNYDIVSGDATPAYGGSLSKAQRTLVYLRPNLILVYDNLASGTARQWEWNIHAINQMTALSDTRISLQNGGQKLCVSMLAGPTMRFAQTNRFTANPSGNLPAQWHGNFYSTARLAATEFVALLNVGCTTVTASAVKANGNWTVAVGDKTVTIASSGIASVAGSVPPPISPSSPTPYSGSPIAVPGSFEAENFDRGGEGLAYHDALAGNQGGQYRTSEDVDIITSTDDTGGGFVVNNIATGEWLAYTLNVAAAGKYLVGLRASQSYGSNMAFHIEIDGAPVTGSVIVPNTGSWSSFQWVNSPAVTLAAGKHVLKVVADRQYFDLNSIRVMPSP